VAQRLQRLVPREFAERLLATRGQIAGERRIVTMLFSDVKGSTPMAERLDPEDVLEIMDGAFDVLIEPITRYEGALARLMGDGILAFFGAPIAHEDDAERACRAALEILEGARGYAARLEAEWGISGFNVRVGIHTGLVVVGEVGSDLRVEYTAMGDAVNTASRMEEAAEPGTVLITEDTHRLIAPLFQTEPLGPMEMRGKAEPVSVYRVLASRAVVSKPRGIEGLESPLVGRDAEFGALREVLERLQAGVGGIVTVVGEAGIGKSRLVAEVQRSAISFQQSEEGTQHAGRPIRWVEGRCLSYGESMAYLPWVDLLHGLLGMSPEDPPAEVRDALRDWVHGLCPDHLDAVYPFLGRMMSLPLEEEAVARLDDLEPEGLKVLTFRAMERVLEAATRQGPAVLVVEDLHWADASSLELLEQVLALTDRCSLLLVCAFRPYTEHGCWAVREAIVRLYRHRHTDLWLQPLSALDSEALVANLLHVEALPHPLRMRILDHAEGNPFYVEEVIRSLIDSEAIVYDDAMEQWEATRRVEDIAIPDTLQGVLTARIDRLEEEARRVLQLASVIGRIFLYRVLAAIAEEQRELDARLLTLQREEMIRERARVPELEYIFKHHLTQVAAYNGLLRRERRRFHRQVAEAWERLSPERIEEQLGVLAHHWEQAGERERAVDYLRRAGEQAAGQFASAEAVDYFSRALDLTPEEDLAGRCELLLVRESMYDVMGAREMQMQDLETLETLADALHDDGLQAEVALRQARYRFLAGDFPGAITAAELAVELARSSGDATREVEGHLRWGAGLYDRGDYEETKAHSLTALSLARAAGLRHHEARCLGQLGFVAYYQHDLAHAESYEEEARNLFRQLGDRVGEIGDGAAMTGEATYLARGDLDRVRDVLKQRLRLALERGDRHREGWHIMTLGSVHHGLGDLDRARSHYEQAIPILREVRRARGEGLALVALAMLLRYLGDDEAAQELSRQALHLGRSTEDRFIQAFGLTHLGHALAGLRRLDEAVGAYEEALELRRRLGEHYLANEPLAGLARICLAQGDLAQAQAHVEEILDYLEIDNLDGVWEPTLVYLTCYRVLQANDDPRADDILEQGYQFLQERAAKISDGEERRSFLERVAANRELVETWEEAVTEWGNE